MRDIRIHQVLAAGLAAFALISMATPAQTAASGKELFEKRCGGCHSLDRDKEGPRLGGVYGRTAGWTRRSTRTWSI